MQTVVSLTELIDREASSIARSLLERELAKQDLPLPKEPVLELHITQLLLGDPTIRDRARLRVEARQDAFSLSMAAIGVDQPKLEIIDTSNLEF